MAKSWLTILARKLCSRLIQRYDLLRVMPPVRERYRSLCRDLWRLWYPPSPTIKGKAARFALSPGSKVRRIIILSLDRVVD